MVKCSFCGDPIPPSKGKIFAKNDGRIFYFHGSKCQKNFKLGRQGVKTGWTALYRKKKAKETKSK